VNLEKFLYIVVSTCNTGIVLILYGCWIGYFSIELSPFLSFMMLFSLLGQFVVTSNYIKSVEKTVSNRGRTDQ
jgi:hypothetical protein